MLIGYSEYASPSSPPLKYLVQTYSGYLVTCLWLSNSACSGSPFAASAFRQYGSISYDPVTGNPTSTAYNQPANRGSNCTLGSDSGSPTNITAPDGAAYNSGTINSCASGSITNTQTTTTATGTGACSGTANGCIINGPLTKTLSSPDTETNAINRLLAGAGGTWGSWIVSGAAGCTGTPPSCCLADYEQRTTAFTFDYHESQFQVTQSGLTPTRLYYCQVQIYRRTYGTGTYTLFQTLYLSATTDGSGNFSLQGNVPNAEGYQSYAAAAYILE